MKDQYEEMTDAEIGETFASKIACWRKSGDGKWRIGFGTRFVLHNPSNPEAAPPFATDIVAIAPYAKQLNTHVEKLDNGDYEIWCEWERGIAHARDTSLPRALCQALLRYHEAKETP